jgi:hypothetical protein
MKKLFYLFILLCAMVPAPQAAAVLLSVLPSSQSIGVGEPANVDLVVSGLGDLAAPSLGAFALDLTFAETVLAFDSVMFGTLLGDESLGDAVTGVDTSIAGVVGLDEVSLLSVSELNGLQPGEFTLASLIFTGSSAGFSDLVLDNVVLSDATGFVIADPTIAEARVDVVPEPLNILLLVAAMAGAAVFGWRRFKYLENW